jgi:hypothetical protein
MSDEAKMLAAGPLGQEMSKFPLKFATSVFFGELPAKEGQPINNGTALLLNFGSGVMAVTCSHVIEGYRKKLKEKESIILQIGGYKFNPLDYIIDESSKLDLVTIRLPAESLSEVLSDDEIAKDVFSPRAWPPPEISNGAFVSFGGYPGSWRTMPQKDQIIFDSFSSGACKVASVGDDYLMCKFEREYWVKSFSLRPDDELPDIGGLSGAPVFLLNETKSGITVYDFIGIIYEFSSEFELMRVRLSRFIRKDGSIIKSS